MTIGQSAEEDLSFLLINEFVPIINPIETHFDYFLALNGGFNILPS